MSRNRASKYDKGQYDSRSGYANSWLAGDIYQAPCHNISKTGAPLVCLASVACPCCMSYWLRYRALHSRMELYTCCGGYTPCSGKCGESNAPECCLGLEVLCCFAQSVMSTRFMLQDELRVQNSKCDNCLMGTVFFLQQLACICDIIAIFNKSFQELANIIDLIADLLMCSVCACMQTQHKIELDARDEGTRPGNAGALPYNPTQPLNPQHQSPYPHTSAPYGSTPVAYQGVAYGQPVAPQPVQTGYTVTPVAPQPQTMV